VSQLDKSFFITLTGVKNYFGMKPFEPGRIVRLLKEPQNAFDAEAISVELPCIGQVAYVANSADTVARGTSSAGRIYDLFGQVAYGRVLFMTHTCVICLLVVPEEEEGEGDKDEKSEKKSGIKGASVFSDKIEDSKPAEGFIGHGGKGFCFNILDM
jgi:hypothetical protein